MKVHVEIDCTPEEARTFMGLPDVGQANDVYVEMMTKAMKGVGSTEKLQEYANQLAPMGQVGMKLFQNFIEGAVKAQGAASGAAAGKSDKDK
ncbi:hypothetical protein EB810_02380 [Altererythrobacter sp. FM1]|uniref:Uncharacterized protein n=1 Tax=Tsuneonella flava TaxID=2055955 RepID=A0ABX7KA05_9SPHN|nr:DUF6489 family protein [Tsuneonella flava]QSB45080.1 hypothetical protein IDJ81_02680 [Tsuneonella flava]ROT96811.1 hypothetical protein EB810_02380 [Altererythrobacter sp. FM1]UBS33678.1 DUF6489 family protein [Altererythrobacter sp. N1]